jgi:hypothetical protein
VAAALQLCLDSARDRKQKLDLRVGDARGVDKFVKAWADASVRSKFVTCKVYEAKWHDPCVPGRCDKFPPWNKQELGAHRRPDPKGSICPVQGFVRNELMCDDAPIPEYLLAFIHQRSKGATQCYDYAREKGIEHQLFRS